MIITTPWIRAVKHSDSLLRTAIAVTQENHSPLIECAFMATRAVFSKAHDKPHVWILNLTPSEPKMNFPSLENMKASSVKLWTLLSITEQIHQHKINLVIYTLASINLKDLFLSKYGRVGSKVRFWKKMVFKSWSSDRKPHAHGGRAACRDQEKCANSGGQGHCSQGASVSHGHLFEISG